MSETCEVCGCTNIERRKIHGALLEVCLVCDHKWGDDEAIERVLLDEEAADLGIEPGIYPLVKALGELPGIKTTSSCEGHPELGLKPYITFRLGAGGAAVLEKVLQSVTLLNQRVKGHWIIEAALQPGLVFTLKPKIPIRYDSVWERDIQRFQDELPTLTDAFKRYRHLTLWQGE